MKLNQTEQPKGIDNNTTAAIVARHCAMNLGLPHLSRTKEEQLSKLLREFAAWCGVHQSHAEEAVVAFDRTGKVPDTLPRMAYVIEWSPSRGLHSVPAAA